MRRKKINPFRIESMIEDLKKVEERIAAHKASTCDSMVGEWEYRKSRVFEELLDHIETCVWPTNLADKLTFIYQLTKQFYPETLSEREVNFGKEPIKKRVGRERLAQAA